jgi:polyisoprenoid-binding protein YceI
VSIATAPAVQSRTTWQIDPAHSLVEFSVRHMMVSTVKGRFTRLSGTVLDVAEDPSLSSVQVEIEAASITTGDEQRDTHLRSADFFDAESYPAISFKSTRIEGDRDAFKVVGDLTLHGVTREIVLGAEFNGVGTNPWGKRVAGFSAETKLNRKDFGLNWNVALEAGGVLVSDTIKVQIELQAVEQAAA